MYFNGLLLLSAQFVRIATNDMLVITNGTVFVSAHRVQIATGQQYVKAPFANFVSAHRVQIATVDETGRCYVYRLCLSAPRADRNRRAGRRDRDVHLCLSAPRADRNRSRACSCRGRRLCLSAPRADRNSLYPSMMHSMSALSQRTACRSQRQMCTKHRVRICGMRCKSVDSFSQHEDLLRADYFPELFCYQSSLRCH